MEVKRNGRLRASLLEHRLLVLIGKGGVGKTSLSAALGMAASRLGRRVLLAEVRSPRRLPPLFGVNPESDGPIQIAPGIEWINLNPQAALETYAGKLLRFRSVFRAVFERQAVRRFLRAVPSLAEILMLGHLAYLLEQGTFDLAVLDSPSTGPGTLLLEAPRVVLETAPKGPLYDGAAWIHRLISSEAHCAVHLVAVPEELPVSEAIELYQRLHGEFPLSLLLINRVLADPFPPLAEALLVHAGQVPEGQALADASRRYRLRLAHQEHNLDRLRAGVDLPALPIPEVFDPGKGRAAAEALAESLRQAAGAIP